MQLEAPVKSTVDWNVDCKAADKEGTIGRCSEGGCATVANAENKGAKGNGTGIVFVEGQIALGTLEGCGKETDCAVIKDAWGVDTDWYDAAYTGARTGFAVLISTARERALKTANGSKIDAEETCTEVAGTEGIGFEEEEADGRDGSVALAAWGTLEGQPYEVCTSGTAIGNGL